MRSDSKAALLFLTPGMLIIFFFFLLPAAAAFLLSLTDFDIYALGDIHNIRLVGLANYRDLLSNARFWRALLNTIYFTLVGGPLTVIVSLAAALLLKVGDARHHHPRRLEELRLPDDHLRRRSAERSGRVV